MASNSSSPLLFAPLHVVGYILEHLDSFEQLGQAISSHRIFYNAFKEYPRCVAQAVITTQIPEKVLLYALLSVETNRITPGDFQTLKEIIARFYPINGYGGDRPANVSYYQDEVSEAALASPALLLNKLSWSEYVSLIQDYEAVLLLGQAMAQECVAKLGSFGITRTGPLTAEERFRLDRSFYLFQAICNTFCTEAWPNGGWIYNQKDYLVPHEDWRDEYAAEVLSCCFSPWVNHQVQSVYRFLESNIVTAFRYIAENDVGYAGWKLRHSSVFQDCLRHDELFTRGLCFHANVKQAEDYETRSKLLKPPSNPDWRWDVDRLSEVFRSLTYPSNAIVQLLQSSDMRVGELGDSLGFLQGTQDGEFDNLESQSCRSWKYAYRHCDFNGYGLTTYTSWLLECAYVMWDLHGTSDSLLSERLNVMMMANFPPEAEMCDEEYNEFIRSRTQREQIYSRGGEGWWPTKGVDFSRVTRLTDQDKEELLSEWRENGWVEPLKRKRSGSSSSCSSVQSTVIVSRRYT
ncbi:hypothetical protein FVEG_12342 [Fusarium verticillioides 7600]|uniref:Uncharacterized protein n=1 Tax=Gibberella moniliformis (strain M3125 / FGSC 7600) TaxID=334819 RepID=W7N1P7_GIBM7|nr:hypothetical protein FVEG_12342 [Fusarium verticillioides 7600]EWG54039.1 hypothetical protein FVEG_12342 [Fusarium verticillioides 7600]